MRSRLLLLAIASLMACSSSTTGSETRTDTPALRVAEGEPVSKTTTVGPVEALVTVSPAEPVIGDIMALTLEVTADEGVRVQMPAFKEAFTRLSVEDFSGEQETSKEGQRYQQDYLLQAASSGRLRVPPMRIVFVDERPGKEGQGEERELLTEEISIKVEAVLPGEEASEASLRPVRRALEEDLGPSVFRRFWWAFAGGVLGLVALVALLFVRRSRKAVYVSPYERASVALAELEAQGLPEAEVRDAWYVDLSGIVRHYLEDRFGLRAPELTTEEFLRVAQRSALLSADHKALLKSFLADCDRVKFAGYEPGADESREVLEAARRFLLETREETLTPSESAKEPLDDDEDADDEDAEAA